MFAVAASANPSCDIRAVDTYIVVPPRAGPFQTGGSLAGLQAALTAAFPGLTVRVSLLDAMREATDPVVVPLMGTAGTGNIGGRILPVTNEIEDTKERIAAAVLAFDPAAKLN